MHRLTEIAKAEGRTRSDIIRLALSQFLASYGKHPEKEHENILEARLRKMENRLADLTVLATRASAQALYYMTLPYSRGGFPTRPLKEEAFQSQWEKSRAFAAQFLRNASTNITPKSSEPDSKAS
jgi:hypothetical protein